ncbi:uncharacterized protein LTR77_010562 [Saxophila tyrrhenica]|uniref:DUF7605 domain-containing protein n=1 Tax=Saxophila tyrrhenica TaxID=1690608 RepID=A0AAV9NYI5_9PEZI|nr:hypothetical protein LTR77_010562 [Saxophila tyrrhenica]
MALEQSSPENSGKRKRDDDIKDEDEESPLFLSEGVADEGVEVDDADNTYNETKEPFPHCAAYDQRSAEIHARMESFSREVGCVLRQSVCHTEFVAEMRDAATTLSRIPDAKRPVIGLLADTGQGHSLINSIVDIPNLAKAIDLGESCTYVAMLYHKAAPTQVKKFSATVEYFPLDIISKLLSNALDDWEIWHFHRDSEWDPAQRDQHQLRAKTCLSIFRAIFCTNTQDALRELVDPLISAGSNVTQKTLWPLVKQVSVGIRGSRFTDRFSVCDLPGISDTNQVRVRATYEQIDHCDYIWILSRAGRIITDTVLDGLLQRYGKLHRGSLAVVVTKSDENVNRNVATELSRRGYSLEDYESLKAASDDVKKGLDALVKAKGRGRKTPAEKMQLQLQIDTATDTWTSLESRCLSLTVQARNQHIVDGLRKEKQHHLHEGMTLDVHCVSNLHYAAHKGDAEVTGALLEPKATGIPRLREAALRMAAPNAMRTLDDFVNHEFDVFFQGLNIWVNQPQWVESRQELIAVVQEPQATVDILLRKYKDTVVDTAQTDIVDTFNESQDEYVSGALAVLEKLKPAAWGTLKAFLRNYGTHKTSAMPYQSWNQQFSAAACETIAELVEDFQEEQASLVNEMQEDLITKVEGVLETLRSKPGTVGLPMRTFRDAIAANVRGIRNIFRDSQEEMEARWNLTGQRSPFAVLATKLKNEIADAAEEQTSDLRTKLQKVLRTIEQQFRSAITIKKLEEPEIPIRDALEEFLIDGNVKFAAIQKDLKDLKLAYGD